MIYSTSLLMVSSRSSIEQRSIAASSLTAFAITVTVNLFAFHGFLHVYCMTTVDHVTTTASSVVP